MSCGLGAIVLVFLLVKHNIDTVELEETALPQVELLREDLVRLKELESTLRQKISDAQSDTAQTNESIQSVSSELVDTQAELATTLDAIARERERLSSLEKAVKSLEVAKTSDVINDPGVGEENYVLGLKVEGQRIAILVDSSASMTDEILIEVIRRKNSPDRTKIVGPKWQRTTRIVRWLLARLPEDGTVNVIAFNDRARALGGRGWKSSRDAKALEDIAKELQSLVPKGGTNLQAGLDELARFEPTNIYLITDGLPTKGESNYKSLNPFADCSSLLGRSSTISGECRLKLFQHTIKFSAPRSGVPVNVILLPIEGDPGASSAYWSWTAFTGGLLISPAPSWP